MSKQKFYFRIHPQGLSVKCTSGYLADVEKLPPLYLAVQKGSHSANTTAVKLTSSKYKPGCFSASWKTNDSENIVEMTLPLTRRKDVKGFESKDIKFLIKFDDSATGKQQCLASCKFDVTTLHLGHKKSERKVLELIPSRSAEEAFKSVSVVMTISYGTASASAVAVDSGSERSGSLSPPPVTEAFVHEVKVEAANTPPVKPPRRQKQQQQQQQIHKQPVEREEEQMIPKLPQVTNGYDKQHANKEQEQQQQPLQQQQVVVVEEDQIADGPHQPLVEDVGPAIVSVDDHKNDTKIDEQQESDNVKKKPEALQNIPDNDATATTTSPKRKVGRSGDDSYSESPVSSIPSPNSVREEENGAISPLQNGDTITDHTPVRSSQLSPRRRALSVDVLSPTADDKMPIFVSTDQQSRRRTQTTYGDQRKKAPPIPSNKSANKSSLVNGSGLGNLRKPVQSSVSSYTGASKNSEGIDFHGKFDILGVLRVQLRGISIPDVTGELMENPSPSRGRSVSVGAMSVPNATHGIYCVFTINGGNTSAKSDTCKILPYRPVLWEDTEKEKLFFTNHSRQLFVLCRKVPLLKKKGKSKANTEVCVGASVMKIIEVTPSVLERKNKSDFTSPDGLQWFNQSLPLQPKGQIELSVCFQGLTPRFKVSSEGVIRVMKVNGIDCPSDVDLSCTVKLDDDMLDSTNVYTVDECAEQGWYDEPISFKARKSLDFVVQIWAYSDDGSAKWCGLTMLPLATLLHESDLHKSWAMTPTGGKDREVFVYHENERTITCPVEPQGTIELNVKIFPDEKIKNQEFVPIEISTSISVPSGTTVATTDEAKKGKDAGQSAEHLSVPRDESPPPGLKRQGTLRRKFNKDRGKQQDKPQESQARSVDELRQENTDLKREVEYLREQLRMTKAKLADSEFHKEKAEAELRTVKNKEEKSFRTRIFSFGRK